MPVSIVSVEIHLPEARSLKDKRRIVKSFKDKVHSRYRVSIAETDHQDLRQRAELGIAAVAPAAGHLEDLVSSIRALLDARPEIIVTRWHEQIVETGR
jgi:uncharacterized protein YlxP (DUF503 family)